MKKYIFFHYDNASLILKSTLIAKNASYFYYLGIINSLVKRLKKLSYNIFPLPVQVLGYFFFLISFALILINPGSGEMGFRSDQLASSAAFFFIGLVIISSRTKLTIPAASGFIIRETFFIGMSFAQEKILIPGRCTSILICGKMKRGTGYYRLVLPVSYMFRSYDMVFCGEKGMVKIMNTDYSRAVKVAEFLKENLKMKYSFEPEVN